MPDAGSTPQSLVSRPNYSLTRLNGSLDCQARCLDSVTVYRRWGSQHPAREIGVMMRDILIPHELVDSQFLLALASFTSIWPLPTACFQLVSLTALELLARVVLQRALWDRGWCDELRCF